MLAARCKQACQGSMLLAWRMQACQTKPTTPLHSMQAHQGVQQVRQSPWGSRLLLGSLPTTAVITAGESTCRAVGQRTPAARRDCLVTEQALCAFGSCAPPATSDFFSKWVRCPE